MTAEDLKTLYETELQSEAENRELGREERRSLRQLLSGSKRMKPAELVEQNHRGIWLWSDLHLGHATALSVFGRPYWTPEEMDDDLFATWHRVVEPRDTIVVLGDVAIRRPVGTPAQALPGRARQEGARHRQPRVSTERTKDISTGSTRSTARCTCRATRNCC